VPVEKSLKTKGRGSWFVTEVVLTRVTVLSWSLRSEFVWTATRAIATKARIVESNINGTEK
jgi:hypothetical protein